MELLQYGMNCFEKLVWDHITSILPPTFDPHQFAYKANRSTKHAGLSMEHQGTYVRLLFVDFSSPSSNINWWAN